MILTAASDRGLEIQYYISDYARIVFSNIKWIIKCTFEKREPLTSVF